MASTNPARGMRDFLPADVRKRNYVIGIIKEVYESYGFEPLETPSVENLETLTGKYGEEGNQLIFRVLTRGAEFERGFRNIRDHIAHDDVDWDQTPPHILRLAQKELADLALRYDLTVPLARVVANNKNDLPKFFKRYQIQPVWRADRPARGRFREFYQCDVDCIGSESMVVEAEIISAVDDILKKLKFKDFVVRINDRLLLDAMMTICQIDEANQSQVLVILDKLDKVGNEGVKAELNKIGIRKNSAEALMSWTTNKVLQNIDSEILDFRNSSTIREADQFLEQLYSQANFLPSDDEGKIKLGVAIKNLRSILSNLDGKEADISVRIDPSLARGLSYYTGTIMEIVLTDGDFKGSIGGGGRYDGLIGMFGKEQIPACGFSLGLERILVVMEERGMFPPEIAESTPADVMVTIFSDEAIADSLKIAADLRLQGLRVTVYPQADKEDKQWKYANSIGVPWICTVNEDDIAEKMVSFQNLATRERFREPVSDVAAKIRSV